VALISCVTSSLTFISIPRLSSTPLNFCPVLSNTYKSVFAIILFHTMINISPYLFPSNGSHYDPFIFAVLLAITAIAITWLWGTETLGKYRFLVQSVKGEA
jgi:hypothetical protein